jgi:methylmalonyl-CoA epimerase
MSLSRMADAHAPRRHPCEASGRCRILDGHLPREGEIELKFDFGPGTPPGRVHHVAIVVRDLEAALGFYRDELHLPLDVVLPMDTDGVRIAFLPVGESNIELVEPTTTDTGVARFLDSRGEGFHHVCFEVDDIAAELARMAGAGIELIDSAPRRGAEGPVAFIHPRSCHGMLVELIEAPGGPAWTALGYDPVS